MARYLVTPSLYSSWDYYRNGENTTKEDFLRTLRKDKFPPNEAMLRGIQFEDDVVGLLKQPPIFPKGHDDYLDCCNYVAKIVSGSLYQERVFRPAMIGPYDVLLYARADFIKRDYGYDTKFTSSYEIGKYAGSIQHDLTMKCANLPKFAYLVCDGHHIYEEKYNRTNVSDEILSARIYEMLFDIFADEDFAELYRGNWESLPETKVA